MRIHTTALFSLFFATACQSTGLFPHGESLKATNGTTCASYPAPACQSPYGAAHADVGAGDLLKLLPGRWLWCSGDQVDGSELKFGGDDVIGIEFSADASRWWFLVDGGGGKPVPRGGFDSAGAVEVSGSDGAYGINLVESGSAWFPLSVAFTDGPPVHMQLTFEDSAYYVFDGANCDDAGSTDPGGGPAVPATPAALGASCDPNVVLPVSCASQNGATCSVCGYTTAWQCVQPCHLSGTDCPSGQTCLPLSDFTLAGDCDGFDGTCG